MASPSLQAYCRCMADGATTAEEVLVCRQCSLDIRPTTLPAGTGGPDAAKATEAGKKLAVDEAVYTVLSKKHLLLDQCLRDPRPEALQAALVKYGKKSKDVKQLRTNHGHKEVVSSVGRLIHHEVLSSPEEAQNLLPGLSIGDSGGPSLAVGAAAGAGLNTVAVEETHMQVGVGGGKEGGAVEGAFRSHGRHKVVYLHLLPSWWGT
jgi:hypothetical protein